ncbi:MAG: hypothetical protein GX096_14885 [Clostridiales bacterium]|nr:hypothetical protein [Clostridiales bacterium]
MNDLVLDDVKKYILSKLEKKTFSAIADQVPALIDDFLAYDIHFMKLTKVLDENDEQSDNEYDEDDAFEYIYDAYLSDHPQNDDEDMIVATLLNRYMELHAEYLELQA